MILHKKIIVNISFNAWTLNDVDNKRLTRDWISSRMDIFMRFTAKNLMSQTNKNFDVVIQYENESQDIIFEELNRYPKLPSNFHFVSKKEYSHEVEKLINGYTYTYITRLDSDDMFDIDFFEMLHQYVPAKNTAVLICQNGYRYNYTDGTLATFNKESPPFYTLIYKTKDYLAGKRHEFHGHRELINLPHEIIGYRCFCVTVHTQNTTTNFNLYKTDRVIDDEIVKKIVLKKFLPSKQPMLLRHITNLSRKVIKYSERV